MSSLYKAHIVPALKWSRDVEVGISDILVAGLGLVGPMALGAAIGRPEIGLAACVGALAMSAAESGERFGQQCRDLCLVFVIGCSAMLLGGQLAGRGAWGGVGIVLIGALAATVSGFSRPVGRAAGQFALFAIIAMNIGVHAFEVSALVAMFAAGAAWTAGLSLLVKGVGRTIRRRRGQVTVVDGSAASGPTVSQRLRRWRMSYAELAGWQYPIRLALGLALGEIVGWAWHNPHAHWIALTVAIVTRRDPSHLIARSFQRAAGTGIGVILGGLLMMWRPTAWALVAAIAVMAASRPLLKARNYLAYSAMMTPMVVLMMDFGVPASWTTMADRLFATAVGCALVVAAGFLVKLPSFQPSPGPAA